METWLVITFLCLIFSLILKFIRNLVFPQSPLPPGPPKVPIIGTFTLLQQYFKDPKTLLQNLHAKYGPIFTLQMGSHTDIFIANRFLAHQALIQKSTIFADRPKALPTKKIISSDQHDILFSFYGPIWRLLRRNLTSRILHPSRVKSYAQARKWVLDILLQRLKFDAHERNSKGVFVVDHFRYGMFSLLALICFGDKLNENQIREIEESQRIMLLNFSRYNVLNFWPPITKILFRNRWSEFLNLRRDQEAALIPYINARRKIKEEILSNGRKNNVNDSNDDFVLSYVDTLLDLEFLEDEKKTKLDDSKICTLCSEFLNAGTDTTSTALEWIVANLVRYQDIQEKLVEEIKGVIGDNKEEKEIIEEDLQKMPYLKAVILEGLRRHPPLHYVAPHKVTEEVVLNGFSIPTFASINFLVAEIGRDSSAWDDPMAFKPERFMNNSTFDIMGSKEIKMMPFGAGRRMCPGYGLALLHLEYFVANFVWNFEWKAVDENEVDLSEKLQFTIVMKNPLKVNLIPRF
jgi:cytochrome P450